MASGHVRFCVAALSVAAALACGGGDLPSSEPATAGAPPAPVASDPLGPARDRVLAHGSEPSW